jgi:RND family efflux transporter MFP subunit
MRRWSCWLLLVTPLLVLAGCTRKQAEMAPAKPPEVQVSTPIEQEIVDQEEFTGRIEAEEYVDVRARASGYLTEVNFKEGAMVRGDRWFRPGEVLAVIDPRPYETDLVRAEGELKRARSSKDQSKSALEIAETLFNRAYNAGAATPPEELDTRRNAFQQAAINLATAEYAVRVAEANRDTAALNLYFTQVRAPITGRISQKNIRRGNVVKADDSSASAVLSTIVSVDPVYVSFDMDERTYQRLDQQAVARRQDFAGRLFRGQPSLTKDQHNGSMESLADLERAFGDWKTNTRVFAGLSAENGFPHEGRLDFVDNRANAQSGTVKGRGTFPNPQGTLLAGMYARVRIPVGMRRRALLVSAKALGTDQGRRFLFVVDADNKVAYRPVEVGQQVGGLVVIESGLKANERVVVVGLQRIRAGVKVDPKETEMPDAVHGQ